MPLAALPTLVLKEGRTTRRRSDSPRGLLRSRRLLIRLRRPLDRHGLGRGQSSPLVEAVDPVAADCALLTAGIGRMAGRADVDGQLRCGGTSCERRPARGAADVDEIQVWMMSHEVSLISAKLRNRRRHCVIHLNARRASPVPAPALPPGTSCVSFECDSCRSNLGASRVGDGAHSDLRRCARSMAQQLPTHRRLGRRGDRRAGSHRPAERRRCCSRSDLAWQRSSKRFALGRPEGDPPAGPPSLGRTSKPSAPVLPRPLAPRTPRPRAPGGMQVSCAARAGSTPRPRA
jgi:hypothetical protein